ncbi:MAG: hypothetical protein J6333_12070, partial [Planctomycetes bacterium]|nr:hypothetical protein [Planctomycetota bacterium]
MWDLKTGKLLKAVYGSPKYGGGGAIDRKDPNRFYYDDWGTMEFALDWKTGKSRLTSILYRPGDGVMPLPGGYSTAPQYALYRGGKRYMTNCYNNSPVDGSATAFLFIERQGVMAAVAGMGNASDWALLKKPEFKQCWPANAGWGFFVWSDKNGNAQAEPDEVVIRPGAEYNVQGVTVMEDFSFCVAKLNGHAWRFPVKWEGDVPTYDPAAAVDLGKITGSASTGGCQLLADASDEVVTTQGAGKFHQYSLCGIKGGKAVWSYPSLWPGLHASHNCPYPTFPGELLGTTRLMGGFFSPKGSQVAPLWAVNGNMGNSYVFTRDGLFVATLFRDMRLASAWNMQKETRGEDFSDLTEQGENFWPTIMATPTGQTYMVTHCAIVRVDGLETLRPLPPRPLVITAADLRKAQEYRLKLEEQRRKEKGNDTLTASILPDGGIQIDGKFDDWKNVAQVEIDQRGTAAYFDSAAQAYNVTGKMAVDGKNLYACWDSNDRDLLRNSGEMPVALFKTGGCLDVMIATNPAADPNRRAPVAGDTRLLVTKVKDQVKAYIYRQVVPGTPADKKVPFSSPWRTINFDEARDVSGEVRLADDGQGRFEVAVPLKVLGLAPKEGVRFKGDMGILRGNGSTTTARIYWANKATMITEDVPSEAELLPGFWGNVVFKK